VVHIVLKLAHPLVAQLVVTMHEHAALHKLQFPGGLPQLGQLLVVVQYE